MEHKSGYIDCLFTSRRKDTVIIHPHIVHLAPVEEWVVFPHLEAIRLGNKGRLRLDQTGAVRTEVVLGSLLDRLSLDADLLELPYLRIFVVDGRVSLFPLCSEILELLAVDLASIVSFIVFFDFGDGLKLLDDLLVVTSALSGSPIMEILFKGFEDL